MNVIHEVLRGGQNKGLLPPLTVKRQLNECMHLLLLSQKLKRMESEVIFSSKICSNKGGIQYSLQPLLTFVFVKDIRISRRHLHC